MSEQAVWEKLLKLKPMLPRHAYIQQRYYGEELWYILNDKASGKFHRFNSLAYLLLGFMDGRHSLDQIIASATQITEEKNLGLPPEQSDLIELLQYLYVADLLVCDFTPSTEEMFNRKNRKREVFWLQLFKNPYVWKISIFNPDRLLAFLLPLARLLSSPLMGVAWLALVLYACLQVGNHWPELSQNSFDHILSTRNLFLLWLIYPVLKVVHELGHGLFTKVWGGSVNEFGVVFILGTPLPYVDATSATAFPKSQRLMVGAAGMAVEIFFAALAFVVWTHVNDGLLKDICFNIMLIGGVSTLFFNGNPLMKFDGYHIMTDAIDQPNLAARAIQQLRYLIRYYGFDITSAVSPSVKTGESWGLAVYGVLAFLYRFVILVSIVAIVFNHFPRIGVLLAIWLGLFQIVFPLIKYMMYLSVSKDLGEHRLRAIVVSSSVVAIVTILLFTVPMSQKTSTQGVVWLPKSAKIQAETSGEVSVLSVEDGQLVEKGQVVIHLVNHALNSELLKKKAYLKEFQSRYEETWSIDQTKTRLFEQDIAVIQSEISLLQSQVDNLLIRSPSAGVFKKISRHQLLGSFVKQGDTVGLVMVDDQPQIRVAVTQQEVGLVRSDTRAVQVKLASQPEKTIAGVITGQVPSATYVLPSPVLGTAGGGPIIVDAHRGNGDNTMEQVFIIDLALPNGTIDESFYGMRTYVSFVHSPEVMFRQLQRIVRQAYLSIRKNE